MSVLLIDHLIIRDLLTIVFPLLCTTLYRFCYFVTKLILYQLKSVIPSKINKYFQCFMSIYSTSFFKSLKSGKNTNPTFYFKIQTFNLLLYLFCFNLFNLYKINLCILMKNLNFKNSTYNTIIFLKKLIYIHLNQHILMIISKQSSKKNSI